LSGSELELGGGAGAWRMGLKSLEFGGGAGAWRTSLRSLELGGQLPKFGAWSLEDSYQSLELGAGARPTRDPGKPFSFFFLLLACNGGKTRRR
jgi:hypothetical protein